MNTPPEDPPVRESSLSGPLVRNAVSVNVQIYDDGDGRWILEVVDEEETSHVWDEHFDTDSDAYAEALRALDEEPLAFATRPSGSAVN